MKLILVSLISVLTCASVLEVAAQTSAAANEDPIVGTWRWQNNQMVTFAKDGTFSSRKGGDGKWEFVVTDTVEREYKIYWSGGVSIDTVTLNSDATRLVGRNLANAKISADRISETAPTQKDPIVGTWRWFNNQEVMVIPDGTFSSRKGGDGKWEFVAANSAGREYRFYWSGGKSIDTVTLNSDSTKLSGNNLVNAVISADRISGPAPTQ